MLPSMLLLALVAQDGGPPVVSDELGEALPRLVRLMREGTDATEPNTSWVARYGGQSLFDGSYDWHSCVIAHFALLAHSRIDGDEELAREILARLDIDGLRSEAQLLGERNRQRTITFPYDEAWFLVLLAEMERHRGVPAVEVRQIRSEVEARVLGHLEGADFPDGFRDAEFCGFYRSWLFAYLLVRVSAPVGEKSLARLDSLRAAKLDPVRGQVLCYRDSNGWDFLYLPGILALVDRVDANVESGTYEADAPILLPEGVTIATVHQLGVFLTRLWPLAYDGGRGDAGAWRKFEAGMANLLSREDLWAEDFAACSHWVPQYLWLGYWWAGLVR